MKGLNYSKSSGLPGDGYMGLMAKSINVEFCCVIFTSLILHKKMIFTWQWHRWVITSS